MKKLALGLVALTSLVACAPVIVSELESRGQQNEPLTYQIVAEKNPDSFDSTSLPVGLNINRETGVISGDPVDAGTFTSNISASNTWGTDSKELTFLIEAAEPPHEVVSEKELMIIDQSVIGSAHAMPGGDWSFGELISAMSPPGQAGDFIKNWLFTWRDTQVVNELPLQARRTIIREVINPWKACDGFSRDLPDEEWNPDLSHAPFRLSAIVYRPDLSTQAGMDAPIIPRPEGRFVFDLLTRSVGGPCDTSGLAKRFTVILEYQLPLTTEDGHLEWAKTWHELGALEFGDGFNAKLLQITQSFTARNSSPQKPNGSALSQLRTNEIALVGPWELREFAIAESGFLENVTVKRTPEHFFKNSPIFEEYLNTQSKEVLAGLVLPDSFNGQPLVGGGSMVAGGKWGAGLNIDEEVRSAFAINTCNGCHQSETGTSFRHIVNTNGTRTNLSAFTETDVELRKCLLQKMLGQSCSDASARTLSLEPARVNRTH
jgi:hypothetical protein